MNECCAVCGAKAVAWDGQKWACPIHYVEPEIEADIGFPLSQEDEEMQDKENAAKLTELLAKVVQITQKIDEMTDCPLCKLKLGLGIVGRVVLGITEAEPDLDSHPVFKRAAEALAALTGAIIFGDHNDPTQVAKLIGAMKLSPEEMAVFMFLVRIQQVIHNRAVGALDIYMAMNDGTNAQVVVVTPGHTCVTPDTEIPKGDESKPNPKEAEIIDGFLRKFGGGGFPFGGKGVMN